MIWQILKRDPAWPMTIAFTVCAALAGPWLGNGNNAAVIALTVLMMSVLQAEPRRRGGLFLTALPVPARVIFIAHTLAVLAVVWLPVGAATAAILLFRRPLDMAARIAEVGLIITLWTTVLLSLRPRELTPVRGSRLVWLLGYVAGFLIVMEAPAGPAALICALLSAALFWRTWLLIPPAFQVAPVEVERGAEDHGGGNGPAFAWWPILREVFPLPVLLWVPLLVVQAVSGQWMFAPLMAFFPICACLARMNWVLTLPVPRRAVLAAILGVFTVPGLASWWRMGGPVSAAAGAVMILVAADGWLAARHHRFRRLPQSARLASYCIAAAPFVYVLADAFAHRGVRSEHFLNVFVNGVTALPVGLQAAAGLAAIGALLWIGVRLIDGMELTGPPPATMWDRMSRA